MVLRCSLERIVHVARTSLQSPGVNVCCLNIPLIKGEVYPEVKLCELLVLVHCIHLPLILLACASSGQSYNIDSPVVPNCCDDIDTAKTGDIIA